MRAECIQAVTQAATAMGRRITDSDLRGIEDRIKEQNRLLAQKDRAAYAAMTGEERLTKAAEAAAQSILHEKIKQRQRIDLMVSTKDTLTKTIDAMAARGMSQTKALEYLTGFVADGNGKTIAMDKRVDATAHNYIRQLEELTNLHKDATFLGIMYDKEASLEFAKAMRGEATTNVKAQDEAKKVNLVLDNMLDRYNRKGGDVGKNQEWRLPQILDSIRVFELGKEKFVSEWMQLVDRNKMVNSDGSLMDDARAQKFLTESYLSLSTDGLTKGKDQGTGSIANRHKAHRQIHYKSVEAWSKAMDLAGQGDLFTQLDSHIRSLSRDIAIIERFGPNAEHTFSTLLSEAARNDSLNDKWSEKDSKRVQGIFNDIAGLTQSKYSMETRRTINEVGAWGVASKLGSLVMAQIGDLSSTLSTARAMNISMPQLIEISAKMAVSPAYRSYARSMGYALESMAHSITRFGDANVGQGWGSKAASAVVNIQGANAWNRWLRSAFGVAMASHVSDMNTRFSDLSKMGEYDRFVLESKGVTNADWSLWKLARDGDGNITPSGIDSIPTSEVMRLNPEIANEINTRFADVLKRYNEQNQKEAGWVVGREKKFGEYKTKIQGMIDGFIQTREKRIEDMSQRTLSRAGELIARMDKAELDMEFAKKSIEAMNEKRTDKFMEDVQRGVEWYGRRRSEIGERLGAKRHSSKLAAYANDAAVDRIGKDLSEKFNKLFGPERTEDGFKVVGEVTKALKEFDAYSDKMEQRISNATKKDGTPKKGKEGTIERAEKLGEQTRIEFEAIKQRAETAIEELRVKSEGKLMELEGLKDLIESKKARAENEADIASYLDTEKNRDKVQGLVDTLEFRFNQAGDRSMSEGERLGYRRAMADSRIRQMDKDLKAAERTTGKEVFAKATELEKRIDKRMAELAEFSKSMESNAADRKKITDEMQSGLGRQMDQAAADSRLQSTEKFIGMTLEETHMAVLERSTKSDQLIKDEMLGLIFQFKKFGWAYYQQHFVERANFYANAGRTATEYRAMISVFGTVFGGLSLIAGDIVKGNDPREALTEEKWKGFAVQAFLRGGGLGWMNDVIEIMKDPDRPGGTDKALGPTVGNVVSLFKAAGQGIQVATTEGREQEKNIQQLSKQVYDLGINNTPGQNLWMIRAPLHNIFLHEMHELANPGYMERAKRRGQEQWLGPEGIRAPNFGNIVERN